MSPFLLFFPVFIPVYTFFIVCNFPEDRANVPIFHIDHCILSTDSIHDMIQYEKKKKLLKNKVQDPGLHFHTLVGQSESWFVNL